MLLFTNLHSCINRSSSSDKKVTKVTPITDFLFLLFPIFKEP
ncbi:hypothetical protein KL86DYS1_31094 [uncultured Dysgonomonas sp.]|uniref:Uncharacterized protein n=1 Tax=uncultured Dysgonomonas sp. TaxID=206096 RepID=A0A212K163_9BACT|nr:hypothetical protein KL86DYS1_31094 [uncultured Dysgonomonas sp.]